MQYKKKSNRKDVEFLKVWEAAAKHEALLQFVRNSSGIFCYGAGEYGRAVVSFLQEHKIKLQGVIVSQRDSDIQEVHGLPLYEPSEIKDKLEHTACGIILSLSEKYQLTVRETLRQYGVLQDSRIYVMTDAEMFYILNEVFQRHSGNVLLKAFFKNDAIDRTLTERYERKFQQRFSSFRRIEVQFIHMAQIGSICYWIYHCDRIDKYGDPDVFYLFFPFTQDLYDPFLRGDGFYHAPNQYLANKLKCDKIEVIQPDSLGFWQYCMKNHRSCFTIQDGYSEIKSAAAYDKAAAAGDINSRRAYITFADAEMAAGAQFLREKNVREWVCIAARDSVYRRDVMGFQNDNLNDIDFYRNSDIASFEQAAQYFATQKISSFRMGAKVGNGLAEKSTMIDYARLYRTELLDVFLFSRCLFCLSDPSGIELLASLFSRPVVQVNTSMLTTRVDSNLIADDRRDLMIMQKYWDPIRRRYLTFRDMLRYEIYGDEKIYDICAPANTYLIYRRKGIVPVQNTPEEIVAVSQEMLQRLSGNVEYTQEDIELQERFLEIRREHEGQGNEFFNFRVGRDFLRENKWLLD